MSFYQVEKEDLYQNMDIFKKSVKLPQTSTDCTRTDCTGHVQSMSTLIL